MIFSDGVITSLAIAVSSVIFLWASYLTIKMFSPENVILPRKDIRGLELKAYKDRLALIEKEEQIRDLQARGGNDVSSEKLVQLSEENEKVKKELAEKKIQLSTWQDKYSDLKSAFDADKNEKAKQGVDKKEMEELRSAIEAKDKELLDKISEIEKYRVAAQRTGLTGEKEEGLLSDMGLLKSEIEIKDVELRHNYVEIYNLNKRITQLEIENTQRETTSRELEDLKERFDNIRLEIDLKDSEIERQQEENIKMKEKVEASKDIDGVQFKEQIEQLGAQMYAKDEEIRLMGEEIDKLKSEITASADEGLYEGFTSEELASFQDDIKRLEEKADENKVILERAQNRIMEKLRLLDDKTKESVERIAVNAGSIEYEAFRKMVHLDDTERKYINKIDALKLENEDLKRQIGLK